MPGLEKFPYNIFGWIDGSINRIGVPFSGPAGDFIGTPCRVQYINAQESVYSGWKKLHGIQVETVLLPNGISTVFGPVSARQSDRCTLNLSSLNCFLTLIQASLHHHRRCMLFGDSIFRGLLQYIATYYRALLPNVLTVEEGRSTLILGLLGCQLKKTMASPIVYLESATHKEATSWLSNTPMLWNSSGCVTFLSIVTSVLMGIKRAV